MGREEVIVLVIALPPGAVAEMTDVTRTGVKLVTEAALALAPPSAEAVVVGVVTAVEVTASAVDVCVWYQRKKIVSKSCTVHGNGLDQKILGEPL